MENHDQAKPVSEGSGAGSGTPRRDAPEESAAPGGRRRASGGNIRRGGRASERPAPLRVLPGWTGAVPSDQRGHREKTWSMHGPQLEHGAEARHVGESRIGEANARRPSQAHLAVSDVFRRTPRSTSPAPHRAPSAAA